MSHTHNIAVESFWVAGFLISVALVYLRGWLRLHRLQLESVADWHGVSFALGLFLIWVATASPLAALDHEMLTAHMIQHLLLMTFVPPLLLLGRPVKPILHGVPQRLVQIIDRPLQSVRMQHLVRWFTHPAVCWFGATATLVVWHIPAVFALSLQSQIWHCIEQVSFLVTGLLFWWPVMEPSPRPLKWPASSILLYLFLATLPCDILSGFLVFCDRVVYRNYISSLRPFGLSALEDQQCAGALMWTCVTVVYLIAASIVAVHLLSPHRGEERSILQFESAHNSVRTDPQRMEAV